MKAPSAAVIVFVKPDVPLPLKLINAPPIPKPLVVVSLPLMDTLWPHGTEEMGLTVRLVLVIVVIVYVSVTTDPALPAVSTAKNRSVVVLEIAIGPKYTVLDFVGKDPSVV